MRRPRILAACCVVGFFATDLAAQQVTLGTPAHRTGDSFFERIGTNWGVRGKGFDFSFGNPAMATPPFGNFRPGSGLTSGVGFQGGKGSGFFNFAAEQGSTRSLSSQTPSLTVTNGMPGSISATTARPFVIGAVPVVGGFPTLPYPYGVGILGPGYGYSSAPLFGPPIARVPYQAPVSRIAFLRGQLANQNRAAPASARAAPKAGDLDLAAPDVEAVPAPAARLSASRASSAGRAVPSVAEARRLHAAEQAADDRQARLSFERGRLAEEAGKPGVAKIHYQMALRRADGELRRQIQARLDALAAGDAP